MCAKLSGGEQFLDYGLDACKRFRKIGIADFRAIDANTLVDSFQVRGSIQPGTKSGLPENRLEKSCR